MDTKKIFSGTLVWTIGLFVPMLWHALLMNAAVQEDGYTYSYHSMIKYFFKLPWIVWPYLIAMGITGTTLVLSGIRSKPE